MKKLSFLTLLIPIFSFAQPSDSEIKQKAISAGATEVRFTTDKGTIHTNLNEKWYMRTMESKWNTDYPEIKRWERNEYRYDWVGGRWVFKRSYQNSSWFDGIPNPSEAEIIAVLEKSKAGYQNCVMEKPVFRLASDPKWNWHTYNSVEMLVEAVYYEKVSSTELAKKKSIFPVRLYRDTGNGQHDPNTKKYYKGAPWLPITLYVLGGSYSETTVLESKTYSVQELEKIKTINEIYAESDAKAHFSTLVDIQIPEFKSDQEVIVWIHNHLFQADKKTVESILFRLLSAYYFENGSSYALNENGTTLVNNILSNIQFYPLLFCKNPEVKHQQDNMIQLYDRELQSFNRIALIIENGLYKIQDLDFYFNPSEEKLNDCRSAGESNCGKELIVQPKVVLGKFSIGDKVVVNWNGQNKDFYKGKIQKVDPYNENRYFIEFDQIQSAWIEAKYISIQK